MHFYQKFMLLCFILSITHCQTQFRQKPPEPGCCYSLPKKRPSRVSITYYLGHAGVPTSDHVSSYEIHLVAQEEGGTSTLKIHSPQSTNTLSFMVTADEMDILYQKFLQNKFEKIQTTPWEAYDVGANIIRVSWLDENNQTRMAAKYRDGYNIIKDQRFDFLISELKTFVKEKIQKAGLQQIQLKKNPNELDAAWEILLNAETPIEQKEAVSNLNFFQLPIGQNLIRFTTSDSSKKQLHFQIIDIKKDTSCLYLKMQSGTPTITPCS